MAGIKPSTFLLWIATGPSPWTTFSRTAFVQWWKQNLVNHRMASNPGPNRWGQDSYPGAQACSLVLNWPELFLLCYRFRSLLCWLTTIKSFPPYWEATVTTFDDWAFDKKRQLVLKNRDFFWPLDPGWKSSGRSIVRTGNKFNQSRIRIRDLHDNHLKKST